MTQEYQVIIIGAGAAGVGCGVVLQDLGIDNFAILERHEVGASFNRWPKEMRFISPSFASNGYGLLDLNAVALHTSPAFSLQNEHPTGREYAQYLANVASYYKLPIQTGVEVTEVRPLDEKAGFEIETSTQTYRCQFLIWAAGEFQYPNLTPFDGAEHCIHNATIQSWEEISGDEVTVIGGYESGIDAAVNLIKLGKRVRILDAAASWNHDSPDPSISLSPYTMTRLRDALPSYRMELYQAAVSRVSKEENGYVVWDEEGGKWKSETPPVLATGFKGSLSTIDHLFDWHPAGWARLTEHDESTKTPGLFVVGPAVQHGHLIFCFIYKFRQRFAIVGNEIATQLGLDTEDALQIYRQNQMFLDDLSCCDDQCAC